MSLACLLVVVLGALLAPWIAPYAYDIQNLAATNQDPSLAHWLGRRRYATTDESRNSLFLALITMGEGWHNNHHYFPKSTSQGFYWWEIDMSYMILRALAAVGIVWDLQTIPKKIRDRRMVRRVRSSELIPSEGLVLDAEPVSAAQLDPAE